VQLAQSATQPGATRPAISVIQLRPGSTTATPTSLPLPAPLTLRSGQPLTLVAAAPTTSGVRLNQVYSSVAFYIWIFVTYTRLVQLLYIKLHLVYG